MSEIISTQNLIKKFSFPEKTGNFFRDLVAPKQKSIVAVDDVSFSVEEGESLAFIGPNGAGKSTTIKMLTGILYPTSGEVRVAGLDPTKERQKLSYKIGLVFAQRSQLIFNLPVIDSFDLFRQMFNISKADYSKQLNLLVDSMNIGSYINQPVRKLSLGQRMRAEIALSLIHSPKIIFLDEPTVGLDIVSKKNLREALNTLNHDNGVTIFLTSHDAGDIEALSKRTIIVNNGKILIDKPTNEISQRFMTKKIIKIQTKEKISNLEAQGVHIIKSNESDNYAEIEVDTAISSVDQIIRKLVNEYTLLDMNIEELRLEDVIADIYQKS